MLTLKDKGSEMWRKCRDMLLVEISTKPRTKAAVTVWGMRCNIDKETLADLVNDLKADESIEEYAHWQGGGAAYRVKGAAQIPPPAEEERKPEVREPAPLVLSKEWAKGDWLSSEQARLRLGVSSKGYLSTSRDKLGLVYERRTNPDTGRPAFFYQPASVDAAAASLASNPCATAQRKRRGRPIKVDTTPVDTSALVASNLVAAINAPPSADFQPAIVVQPMKPPKSKWSTVEELAGSRIAPTTAKEINDAQSRFVSDYHGMIVGAARRAIRACEAAGIVDHRALKIVDAVLAGDAP